MITIRTERPVDERAREALLDAAYGPTRFSKPSARLRKSRKAADELSFVAIERGRIVGSVRLWHINAGRGRPALMLGPLAVHPDWRSRGIGAALMRHAIAQAAQLGHGAVILVGDTDYYGRFGFSAEKTKGLWLAGADPARLLALELVPDSLLGARGAIAASGERDGGFAAFAERAKVRPRLVPRAA